MGVWFLLLAVVAKVVQGLLPSCRSRGFILFELLVELPNYLLCMKALVHGVNTSEHDFVGIIAHKDAHVLKFDKSVCALSLRCDKVKSHKSRNFIPQQHATNLG